MRRALLPGILVGGLLLAGTVTAPTQATEMVVIVPEVEVRSGPSPQYYPTARLKNGDRVTVLKEAKSQPGWLAIKPPAGSFSWINARFVKQVSNQSGVIMGSEDVAVMPGSALTNQRPNVEQVKVKPGFIVAILDRPLQMDNQTWLPVLPPPGEVRYLPASALSGGAVGNQPSAIGFQPAAGSRQPTAPSHPLVTQADQAYLAGNLGQAKQLYQEAAARTTDQSQRIYCYNRLATLNKGSWTPPASQMPPVGHPQHASGGAVNPPPIAVNAPRVAAAAPAPQAGKTTSLYGGIGQPAKAAQWSAWGLLRRTAFAKDGQPMYVLENRQGQALIYVTTPPGISLQPYLGQTICVFGTVHYRSDDYQRANYLVASHVALP